MAITYDTLLAYVNGLNADGSLSDADYNQIILYILANGDLSTSPRDLIQVRRGNFANLPTLAQGEFGLCLDSEQVFIGGSSGNILLPGQKQFDSLFINALYPPSGMLAAKGDGVTDDLGALQSMLDAIASFGKGELYLPAALFRISAALNISGKFLTMRGQSQTASRIVVDGSADGLKAIGTSAEHLACISFKDFMIYHGTTPASAGIGITLMYADSCSFRNVEIKDFLVGRHIESSNNVISENVLTTFSSGSASPVMCDILNGSASSVFTNDWQDGNSNTGNSIGVRVSGTQISDLTFESPQFSGVKTPMYFDGSGVSAGSWTTDIYVHNPIIDGSTSQGIGIVGMNGTAQAPSIVIDGGWINPINGAITQSIYIQNSKGVLIRNLVFNQLAGGNIYNKAIKVTGTSSNISITGCEFINTQTAILFDSANNCIASNNMMYNESGKAGGDGIYCQFSNRISVNGNLFSGYNGRAFYAGNDNSNCLVANNIVDPTYYTGSIVTNSSTGGVTVNNITT